MKTKPIKEKKVEKRQFSKIIFYSFLVLIVGLGIFFRVYHFDKRFGLGSDDIRDVLIAKEALIRHELPLIGSFSSAGPFVFGPLFYWFIMVSFVLMPFTFLSPWILLAIVGLLTIIILMYIGYLMNGLKMALIVGISAATSQQLVNRSIALNQHSLVGITSALLLLCFILYWRKKKNIYAFLMGVSLGVGINMHYQALNLGIFLLALLFVPMSSLRKKLFAFFLAILGVLIPSLPLLWWDSHQQFANIRNILDYFLIAQNRLYVPNSWKLYFSVFFVPYWSYVTGGYDAISIMMMIVFIGIFILLTVKRKISSFHFTLGVIFLILIFANRYYKGERFFGYFIYLSPLVILLWSWALTVLISLKEYGFTKNLFIKVGSVIGYAMIIGVIIGNIVFTKTHVLAKDNRIAKLKDTENKIMSSYPGRKFHIYDYKWQNSDNSYPLSAFLNEDGKITRNGVPIGVIREDQMKLFPKTTKYITKEDNFFVVPLRGSNSAVKNSKWVPVNPEDIYNDLMQWTKTKKLQSNFSLTKYMFNIIGIKQ